MAIPSDPAWHQHAYHIGSGWLSFVPSWLFHTFHQDDPLICHRFAIFLGYLSASPPGILSDRETLLKSGSRNRHRQADEG